jgi:hypothetical protein
MIIVGRIIRANQISLLTVIAHDVDFRSNQLLGRQRLEPGAERYRIEYGRRNFVRAEKKSADIVISVVDERGRLLAESEVLFNAPDEARIDIEGSVTFCVGKGSGPFGSLGTRAWPRPQGGNLARRLVPADSVWTKRGCRKRPWGQAGDNSHVISVR